MHIVSALNFPRISKANRHIAPPHNRPRQRPAVCLPILRSTQEGTRATIIELQFKVQTLAISVFLRQVLDSALDGLWSKA